jgi:predicted dehydrogenase
MPIGWAIVSTGRHSDQKMAPAINSSSGSTLVAVVSQDLNRSQQFAAKHGALAAYNDLDSMLEDPNVSVVYIASPNSLHAPQTIKAAAAGKHILVEKPMALSVEECEEMIAACSTATVRLGVGFHLRNHPGHQTLRVKILNGSLGVISLAQAHFGSGLRGFESPPPRPSLQKWWEDASLAGAGAFMGTGVHCVDTLRYVLGQEITSVMAITDATAEQPLEHLVAMLLQFDHGAIGTIVSSRKLPDSRNDLTIYGSLGRGMVTDSMMVNLQGELSVATDAFNMKEIYRPPDPIEMYVKQVDAFNFAIESNTEPPATGLDGLKAAQVTSAMLQSSVEGHTVNL